MKLNEALSVSSFEKGFILIKLESKFLNLETLQLIPQGFEKIKQFSNVNGVVLCLEDLKGPSFHDFNLYTQKEGLLSNYIEAGKNCLLAFENFNLPLGIYIENFVSDMAVEFLLKVPFIFYSPGSHIKWNYYQVPIFPLFGTSGDFFNFWGLEESFKFFIEGKNFPSASFPSFEIPKQFLMEGLEYYFKNFKNPEEKAKNLILKKVKDYVFWYKKRKKLKGEILNLSKDLVPLFLKDKLTKEEEEIYIRNYLLKENTQNRLKYLVMKEGLYNSEVPQEIETKKSFLLLGFSREGKDLVERGAKNNFKMRVLEDKIEVLKENLSLLPESKGFSFSTNYYGFKRYPIILENLFIKEEEKGEFINSLSEKFDIEGILLVSLKTLNLKTIEKKYNHPTRILGYNIPPALYGREFVEIIKGTKTSQESIKMASCFFSELGYFPIIVSDKPGFLTLRIVSQLLNEAFYLLEEGYPPFILEKAFKIEGFKKGPLQLGDEIGFSALSTIAQINSLSQKELPKVNKIFSVLAELERFEKRFPIKFFYYKNFQIYKENKKLIKHLGLKFSKKEVPEEKINEIFERFLICLLNASFNSIDFGVVDWLDKIDLALSFVMGNCLSNLPVIKHCDNLGWQHILSISQKLVSKYGERYSPSRGIQELSSIY